MNTFARYRFFGTTPLVLLLMLRLLQVVSAQNAPCDVVQILHHPDAFAIYSPDSSRFFINVAGTAGVYFLHLQSGKRSYSRLFVKQR